MVMKRALNPVMEKTDMNGNDIPAHTEYYIDNADPLLHAHFSQFTLSSLSLGTLLIRKKYLHNKLTVKK